MEILWGTLLMADLHWAEVSLPTLKRNSVSKT